MAIVWSTIENALHAWVVSASGMEDRQVLWAEQDGGAPATGPYVTIRMGDLIKPGGVDGLRSSYDPAQAPGQEILFTTQGPREFTVSVQAFSDDTVGDSSPRALMEKIQSALGLPSIRDALNAAGLGVLDEGQVKVISAIYGTDFEGRALLEVKFMVTATASERVGYIGSVELEDFTGNSTMDIP